MISKRAVVKRHEKVWLLYVNGSRMATFRTKREALVWCQDHPEI